MFNNKQKLTTNAIWTTAPLFVSVAVGFWLLSYSVPKLGIANYGIYVTMIAAVSPLTLLLCGVPMALIQTISRSIGKNENWRAVEFAQTGSMIITIGALFSMGIAVLLLSVVSHLIFGEFDITTDAFPTLNCAWAVAVMTLIQHLSTVPSSILSAMQRFRTLCVCATTQTIATAILQVIAIQKGFGISGFAWSVAIGWTISLVLKIFAIGIPNGFSWFIPHIRLTLLRELLVFGRWQSAAQIGGLVTTQAERLCITGLLGPSATTSFDLCVRAQTPLYTIVWQAMQSLFPFLSSKSEDGVQSNTRRTMRATWISTVATSIILIPFGGLSTQIMTIWMGADIAVTAAPIMTVLAFAGIVGSATNAPVQFLLAIGETRTLAIIAILTGLTNIGSAIILLPILGIRGAGLPALIAMVVQWLYVNQVVSKVGAIGFRETAGSSAGCIVAALLIMASLKTVDQLIPNSIIVWLTAIPLLGMLLGLCYRFLKKSQAGRQGIIDIREIINMLIAKLRVA